MAGLPGNGKNGQPARIASGYRGNQNNQGGNLNNSQGPVPTQDGASLFKQYKEEDGFMRGARIAEKIQEFYHTTAVPSSAGFNSSQGMNFA